MRSLIDIDASLPTEYPLEIPPISSGILTKPVWGDSYLTPGTAPTSPHSGQTTPTALVLPPATLTEQVTQLPTSLATLLPTSTPIPTSTIYYPPLPSPTNTKKPPPAPTNTNTPPPPTATNTPVPVVGLNISKDDFSATYPIGGTTTYTIIVSNNGTNDIIGAQITDNLPAQITSWDWACTTLINATGCDPISASTTNFTDTIDIQNGGSITYTVTAYISSSASGDLVNTATVSSGTDTDTNSDTDTPQRVADLAISKNAPTDVYEAGDTITYTVVVSNNGPSKATGFDISDIVPAQLKGVSVACVASGGNASCGTDASSGNNISFTGASLGAGLNTLSLSISGTVAAGTTINITNKADIIIPPSADFTDLNPTNNTSSHTHQRLFNLPYNNIGGSKDGAVTNIGSGRSVTFKITTQVNGHAGWDLVYYERPAGCGIVMDWVILEVGDGVNWYTVLNWGNGIVDANAIIASVGLPETDNRRICSTDLYDSSGVALDLDTVVPPGTYPYLRLTAPIGDGDGTVEVDAIMPLP